jgi:hypothetical protein
VNPVALVVREIFDSIEGFARSPAIR